MNKIDALKAVMAVANKNLCKEIVSLLPELKEVTVAEARNSLTELLKPEKDNVTDADLLVFLMDKCDLTRENLVKMYNSYYVC